MKLAGVAALALAVSSCGGGSRPSPPPPSTGGPSTPPGVTRVTGSERIAWNQGGDLTGLRFLAFVDDNSVALDQAACNASGECSSPLPPMNDGTHTIAMDWYLPGVAPTGRRIAAPTVAIVQFRDGKIESEHIYWDQASVLVQIGLLEAGGLPVAGVETAEKLRDPELPSNELIARAQRRGQASG